MDPTVVDRFGHHHNSLRCGARLVHLRLRLSLYSSRLSRSRGYENGDRGKRTLGLTEVKRTETNLPITLSGPLTQLSSLSHLSHLNGAKKNFPLHWSSLTGLSQ